MTDNKLKPGLRIMNRLHPEWGVFVVKRLYNESPAIWEIARSNKASDESTLSQSEYYNFWELAWMKG